VALDESGRVSLNLLQHHRSKAQALVLYVLDILIYRGRSLLKVPLYFRREVLRRIFENSKAAPIGLSENIEAAPPDMIRVAKEFGFDGIVAKRKDSFYESGKRTGTWVKYKINRGQEFVIGGYTPGNPFWCAHSRVLRGRAATLALAEAEKLGALLFQYPAGFHCSPENIEKAGSTLRRFTIIPKSWSCGIKLKRE
jgi:ATP dependent DNA ligase domain